MANVVKEETVFRKIAAAFAASRTSLTGVRLGIGDDAALFAPRTGCETILSCDWFLEGTHFLRDKHPAEAVGWKSLGRAMSDLAAMGGTPRCFLLSMALPTELTGRWLTGFLGGIRGASEKFGCVAAGGDTTRRKEILINITVVGEVKKGRALLRSGARVGDELFVSGTLGEAELGLRQLRKKKGLARATNAALRKHLYPEPRIALGQWLAEKRLATAMMDLSDGLSTDLLRLCAASGVGAKVEAAALPCVGSRDRADGLALALHGGDDYELLFSVSEKQAKHVPKSYRGLALTRIGKIVAGKSIKLALGDSRERTLAPGGWDPFRE